MLYIVHQQKEKNGWKDTVLTMETYQQSLMLFISYFLKKSIRKIALVVDSGSKGSMQYDNLWYLQFICQLKE